MMFEDLADSPRQAHPAEAPEVSFAGADDQPTSRDVRTEALLDDEGALVHIVRLLNRSLEATHVTAVERAFLAGARVMFEQLTQACDELLSREESSGANGAKADATEAPVRAAPKNATRSRRGAKKKG